MDQAIQNTHVDATTRAPRYKIVRHYMNGTKRTIRTGLYEGEAKQHCSDPETSSRTCTSRAGRQRTAHHGHWFEGYERMGR
jgi:hypothetical protein